MRPIRRWFWVAAWGMGLGACGGAAEGPEVVAPAAEVFGPLELTVAARPDVEGAGGLPGIPDERPSIVVSAELKKKLVELAVAGECARREGVPAERAIPRLEALFATQGVTLAEYSDAMAQLAADKEVHQAIGARLGSCGALVEALWPRLDADVGEAQADAAVVDAVVAADAGLDDGGPGDTRGAPDVADVPNVADVAEVPDVVVGREVPDVVVAPDVEVKVEPKPAPSWAGTWVGAFSGTQSGTLRVTVSGRTVTGAVATFGRSAIRLKGSLSDKGYLSLGGTAGDEFVRLSGRVDRGGQVITGTWDGVVGKKRSSGSLRLSR